MRFGVAAAVVVGAWNLTTAESSAYSYASPTLIERCAGQASCDIPAEEIGAGSFVGARLTRRVSLSRDGVPVLLIEPERSQPRADTWLMRVGLFVSLDVEQRPMLVVARYYERGDNRDYRVDYPVTDPISMWRFDEGDSFNLDLTVYASGDQMWIEARDGQSSLATVRTLPLFFGFGPNDGAVRISVDEAALSGDARPSYFTAKAEALLEDINTRYAAAPDGTPFLVQADRRAASALAAAIVSGSGQ